MTVPERGLRTMRRITHCSLLSCAIAAVGIPALALTAMDLAPAAVVLALAGLALVGLEESRLLMAGMGGLQGAPVAWPRVAAAAAAALALWVWLGPRADPAWPWVLPFGAVASGAAMAVRGRRPRWALLGAAAVVAAVAGGLGIALTDPVGPEGALVVWGVWGVGVAALFCISQVWIWDVTLRLDEARAAAAEVAVLKERLRFAADLHDVQGHQLQAIALKAQLAQRLAPVDPEAAARQAGDAHGLALTALAETRDLVQGYRRVGLATELANAVGILRAAGVEADVTGTPEVVPPALQPLFGSLVREGATNLLRHTSAAHVGIDVRRDGDDVMLRMADDGAAHADADGDGDGTGLAGLGERFAAAGGRVDAGPLEPRGFALTGRAPRRAAEAR